MEEKPLHIKENGNKISVGFLEGSINHLVIDVCILVIVAIFVKDTNLCWITLTLQQIANLFLNHTFVISNIHNMKQRKHIIMCFSKETWPSIDVKVKKSFIISLDRLMDKSRDREGNEIKYNMNLLRPRYSTELHQNHSQFH